MSGFASAGVNDGGGEFVQLSPVGGNSPLVRMLAAETIEPGSPVGYALCKEIYTNHPLGAKMAEVPVTIAQSQPRELSVPGGPEERLVEAFVREWRAIGGIGADAIIRNHKRTSRIYGISTLVMGVRGRDPSEPIDLEELSDPDADVYFNVLDPLNTAGSLVLDQNPNSPDFQKPTQVVVGGTAYHPSRSVVTMNEQPLYIDYTASAFGFSGRSVYQRALYPMRTFLQSMVTDQMVTQKVGLLVWKAKTVMSQINQRILGFFAGKRGQLKAGMTGNVLTVGSEDSIESIDLKNLEGPASMARGNALKNIAMAAGMPAKLLEQETMVGGMAEGQEDAKQIAQYIEGVRSEMGPEYAFMERIVQRRAWTPAFYAALQAEVPEWRKVPYRTAFYRFSNSFVASWPNLLAEPESKKLEAEKMRFEQVVALVQVIGPMYKAAANRVALLAWATDEINSRRQLFSSQLVFDEAAEQAAEDEAKEQAESAQQQGADGGEPDEPSEPRPFAAAA